MSWLRKEREITSTIAMGIYNLSHGAEVPARLGFNYVGAVVLIEPRVRPGDFGISAGSVSISQALALKSADITLWGVPTDPSHDDERGPGWIKSAGSPGQSAHPRRHTAHRLHVQSHRLLRGARLLHRPRRLVDQPGHLRRPHPERRRRRHPLRLRRLPETALRPHRHDQPAVTSGAVPERPGRRDRPAAVRRPRRPLHRGVEEGRDDLPRGGDGQRLFGPGPRRLLARPRSGSATTTTRAARTPPSSARSRSTRRCWKNSCRARSIWRPRATTPSTLSWRSISRSKDRASG